MIQSLPWRYGILAVVLAITAFFLYPSVGPVPALWAKYLPHHPIRLGLDLQGGLHLVLEVQADKAVEAVVDQTMGEASALMKEQKIRYNDVLRTSESTFAVYLKDASQETVFDSTVMDKLGNFRKLSASPADKGYEIRLGMDPKVVEDLKKHAVRQAVDTVRNRVDQLGVAEPDVVVQGEDRMLVQLPGLKEDIDQAIRIIKRTARLEFKLVDSKGDINAALKDKDKMPPGDEILYKIDRNPSTGVTTRTPFLLKKAILMTGDVLTDARVRPDQGGRLYIAMDFNRRGAVQFEKLTGDNVGERLAIVLDDVVYSAPQIKDRIPGGSAIIEGMFSPDEARELALVLRAGSLPAPVKILENRTVGPSLGEDSIREGRNAVIFGLLMVVAGMAVYYRWSGMIANVALFLNLFLILAAMVAIRATLTLPGLAGMALSLGMAIDANVLIFERIKEELRAGKTPKMATDLGYARAFWTIFDSNLTTVLAALPLIQFGTGPIKGFAVTLCIGLAISMFTAMFVTRLIFDVAFIRMPIKRLSI